jgi:general secretion pathway protein G
MSLVFSRCAPCARGFTLIELMVTVALVGILSAIAVPSYQQWRVKTLSRQAGQDIAVLATAIKQYQVDERAYPANLAAVGLSGKLDPWGRAYEYLPAPANGHGGQRKDKHLNPINTDFDLYSKGPDGDTQVQLDHRDSVDDIVRANNGGFIGIAADY